MKKEEQLIIIASIFGFITVYGMFQGPTEGINHVINNIALGSSAFITVFCTIYALQIMLKGKNND